MDKDFASPLVTSLARAVWRLRTYSIHGFAKRRFEKLGEDSRIERWVLFFTFLSLAAFLFAPTTGVLGWLVLALGIYRLYELAINVLHATIFYGIIDKKPMAGTRRIVILLFANLAEIVFWFGYFYRRIPWQFSKSVASFRISALSFSFSTATGVGSPPIEATADLSVAVSLMESALGLFMIVAVLAKFLSGLATDLEERTTPRHR